MVVIRGVLMLFDADRPETLDSLLRAVGVTFVAGAGIDLRDAEREERERQKLECVLCSVPVLDLWEKSILLTGLLVGRRLKSTQGSFDCKPVNYGSYEILLLRGAVLTSEHVLPLFLMKASSWLEVLRLQEFGKGNSCWVRRAGLSRIDVPLHRLHLPLRRTRTVLMLVLVLSWPLRLALSWTLTLPLRLSWLSRLSLTLRLCLRSHLSLVLSHSMSPHLLNILLHCNPLFRCFGRYLLLDRLNLFRSGLLGPWRRWPETNRSHDVVIVC